MDFVQLALFHFEQNESEQAIKLINDLLPTASSREKFEVAYILYDFGFTSRAKTIIHELLDENPENSDYKILLADIFIATEQDDEAIHLLHDIPATDENYLPSLIQLADLYQAQGLYEVAEQKLFEAKQINQEEQIIDLALAELYFTSGEFNRCIQLYEQIIKEADNIGGISITARLAESYAAIGKYEKAFSYFEQISDEDPDFLFKHGLMAFHLERYSVAIQKWERLIEIDPYYYSVYQFLGEAYYVEGMLNKAHEITVEGLNFDEHNDELYFLAAKIALKRRAEEDALQYIERAIELNPDHREYVTLYIERLRKSLHDEKVVSFLRDLLANDIYDPLFEWELAKSLYELDRLEEALPYYEKVYKHFEEDPVFLHEYGYFLMELGNMDKAKNILLKYIEKEPMDEDTIEFLNRM